MRSLADTARIVDPNASGLSELSLREAMMLSNAAINGANPEEIWLPGWKFQLTLERTRSQTTDVQATFGALGISDKSVIRGVANATSVQWAVGTRNDAVFDLLGDFEDDGEADRNVSGSDFTIGQQENDDGSGTETDWEVYAANANDDGTVDAADLAI